jgi:alpha-galactosidase
MQPRFRFLLAVAALCLLGTAACAAIYRVRADSSSVANDGLSPTSAFETIQKGAAVAQPTRHIGDLNSALLFVSAALGGELTHSAIDSGRELVPPQWWTKAGAIVRVSLKQRGSRPAFPLDEAKASAELDALRAKGVCALEIFGPSHSGHAYGGLDPIDRYRPAEGTMNDFRRLVRLIHSKGMAVISFENLGYISLEAPEWLKACDDVRAGRHSREARWFRWSDHPDAPAPAGDSIFLLQDPYRVWRYGHGPDEPGPPESFLSLDWAGRGHWEFSEGAAKYYWTKWGVRDPSGKRIGLPHYDWANPEWQEEAEKILRFWMDTGLDGMIIDAPGMYIDCGWEMTRRRITSVIASYGNVYMQAEGAGSLYENPAVWLSEGGYNSVQDYPLMDLSGTGSVSPIRKAIESGDPRRLEAALRGYHDRVVEEGGVLYLTAGERLHLPEPDKQELALATGVLVGDVLSYGREQALQIGPKVQRLLELKKTHPALQNLSTRRQVPTAADNKHYVFLRTAADKSERILVVINFQPTEQLIDVDLSGVATAGLADLEDGASIPRLNPFKVNLPAVSYKLYQVKLAAALPANSGASPASSSALNDGPSLPRAASRPVMGWNSWQAYGGRGLDEQILLSNARILAEKYKPLGYDIFCVDAGWLAGPDGFGRLEVNTRRFPRGMKAFIADVHALGLKAGVHIMRGIPRAAVRENLPIHGTAYHARGIADTNALSSWSNSHYGVDVDKPGGRQYYDDWIALVASYGVDFIKADDLVPFPRELTAIAAAVRKVSRPIVLSLSPGNEWDTQNLSAYRLGDMLRITSDIWDKRSDLDVGFERWLKFSQALENPAVPGVWPDLDMIPFGHLRIGNNHEPGAKPSFEGSERWCRFTAEQKRAFITQRTLAASPLIIGGQLTDMDQESFGLLTDREMIACDQNGVVGRRVYAQDDIEVWQTHLRGQKASGWLGIFNRHPEVRHVHLTKAQLGLDGADSFHLQDIWRKRPLMFENQALEFELGPDDVCFLRFQAQPGNP